MPIVETVINKIVTAHEVLISESDISPRNNTINTVLRDLVETLIMEYSPPQTLLILNDERVARRRQSLLERLSEAEAALELFWSQKFVSRDTLGVNDLREFLYWSNYERLLDHELGFLARFLARRRDKALQAGSRRADRVVFVGSGPLPLSAILIHLRTGAPVCCIDSNAEACRISARLLEKLGLDGMTVLQADGASVCHDEAAIVFIASLVQNKLGVADRIRLSGRNPLVALRSAEGLHTLLYDPVESESLEAGGFRAIGRTPPDPLTINTTLFYLPPSACSGAGRSSL